MTTLQKPFAIENRNICNVNRLTCLIVVHSATYHFDRRKSFRKTWANYKQFPNHQMRVVFVLGTTFDARTQTLIEMENNEHGDIVQGNFVDSYQNLTHKAVTGLRWINENCPQAQFIVKVDDDVFLNVFHLFHLIENEFQNKRKHIWCHMLPERTDIIPRIDTKWDVPVNEFHNLKCYPFGFCRGYFVVYTNDLITSLFNQSKMTPFFHLDDVYLYGMLPARVGGVNHVYLDNLNSNESESLACFMQETTCEYFVSRVDNQLVMEIFWSKVQTQHLYRTTAINSAIQLSSNFIHIHSLLVVFVYEILKELL